MIWCCQTMVTIRNCVSHFYCVTCHYCMFTLPFFPDAARFHPKVDANGNCETGDKVRFSSAFLLENGWIKFWFYRILGITISCLSTVDQSELFGGSPADFIHSNLTRTTVSAGESGSQQWPEWLWQYWNFDPNRRLQQLQFHRPFAIHHSSWRSTLWSVGAHDFTFQHRACCSPDQHPHTVLLSAHQPTDHQPRDHQSTRQRQHHFPHRKWVWRDTVCHTLRLYACKL